MGNRIFKRLIRTVPMVLALLFVFCLVSPAIADQSKVVLVGGGQAYLPLDEFVLESESPTVAGNSWYVDSGKTASGDGKSWDYAVITINEAYDLCTESNGDVIHVAPNHVETIDAATDLVCDTAGITIIGYGAGNERPTLSWANETTATIPVSDTDVVFKNMIFDGSSTSADHPAALFTITAAGFQLINSKVITGDSTEACDVGITGNADADRMKVLGCEFTGSTDTGTTAAISFSAAAEDIEIAYNTFKGDYSSAAIASASAILDVNIHHNYVYNFNDDDHAIEISSNTATGRIAHCMLVTDAYATALDSGGLDVFETYWANDEVDDVMATPVFTHEDGASPWSATELAIMESEANDALVDENLDHLLALTDGAGAVYPLTAVEDSIICKILGDDDPAVCTSYDNSTDSLEALSDIMRSGITLGAGIHIDHLLAVTDGVAAFPSAGVEDSIICKILGDDDPAVCTTYDNTTDSLEALGNQVADSQQQSNVTASIDADNLDHLVKNAVDTSFATTVHLTSVLGQIADDGTSATFDPATDSLEAIRDQIDALDITTQADLDAILATTPSPLAYTAAVTSSADTTHSVYDALKGFGTDYFKTGWTMIVLWDAGGIGGAPEGEVVDVTAYVTASGTFTHGATTALAAGDKVLFVRDELVSLYQKTLPATAVAGSLQRYIAGGDTGLGTDLGASKSLVDCIGTDGVAVADTATGIAGMIGVNDADNVMDTDAVVPNANGSVYERLEALEAAANASYNHPNYFAVTADLGVGTWNTTAAHEIAAVTGACRLQIMVEVTESVVTTSSDGTIALGVAGNTDAIFAAVDLDSGAADFSAGDVVSGVYGAVPTTPVGVANATNTITGGLFDVVVVGGVDVGYTIGTHAATDGILIFHIWWTPLDATGAVTAGAGGPFA